MLGITGSLQAGLDLRNEARTRARTLYFLLTFALVGMAACDAGRTTTTTPVTAEVLRLDQSSVRLDEGATARLRVLVTDENGKQRELGTSSGVVWSVRDPQIASIENGLVTGLKPGTTQVTAIVAGRQSAVAEVVVLAVPGVIEIIQGNGQVGIVGQALGATVRIHALNRQGLPMSGVQMELVPAPDAGTVSPAIVTLDANGNGQAQWTLGPRAGLQTVDIRVAGRTATVGVIGAHAEAGPVARVLVTPGDALTRPGSRVRFGATAVDQFGNPVSGGTVAWSAVDPTIATMNPDGTAHAIAEGETDIEAVYTSAGAASRADGSLAEGKAIGKGKLRSKPSNGTPEQVDDLTSISQSFTSIVLRFTQVGDGNGAPANYEVRYALTPIGTGFASATVAREGTCASPITGSAIGASLTCSVSGLQSGKSYDFQVVAIRGSSSSTGVLGPESNVATAKTSVAATPALIEVVGGNGQTGNTGSALPNALSVRVRDNFGAPMPNVTVNWAVTSGAGSLSSAVTTTDALGLTEARWTLGSVAGTQGVKAYVGTLEAYFQANAVATPVTIASIAISPSTATVQKGNSVQLAAEARDASGNIVPGTIITWTSSDPTRAVVSSGGQVTGIAAGSTNVTAAAGGKSASASVTVTEPPATQQSPAIVTTLAAESATSSSVTLTFTEVNDGTGNPANYSMRYHVSPIGWNWGSATEVSQGTCAALTGTAIGALKRCTVTGLTAGITYDFQLVSHRTGSDGKLIFSEGLSNVATANTGTQAVASISLTPATATVTKGQSVQLTAVAKDASGNALPGAVIAWSSSDATRAAVNGSGQVIGIAAGSATIRASSGGKEATASITVTDPSSQTGTPGIVTTLAMEGSGNNSVNLRFTEVDDGTGHPANYTMRYYVSPIGFNWGSAPDVSQGTCAALTGSSIGSVRHCTVSGLQSGVTYDFQLVAHRTGSNGELIFSEGLSNVATGTTTLASGSGSLSISPRNVTLTAVGAQQQFTATARDANGATVSNPGIAWTSSDPNIASIDSNGMLTARGVGTIVLTATAACCAADQITVTVQQKVASISVDPASASLTRGQSMRINATARDANGNVVGTSALSWQSSNAGIASVANDGTVQAENAGSAYVTASADGKTASTAISVAEDPTSTPPPPSGGTWPNQPSGATVAIDEGFSSKSLPNAPAGPWAYDSGWSGDRVSASNGALRFTYPQGFAGGSAPAIGSNDRTTMNFTTYYVGFRARWSVPWTNHPTGTNKIMYFGETSAAAQGRPTGQFYLNRRGRYIDFTVQWAQGYADMCPIPYDGARTIPSEYSECGEHRLATTPVDDGNWHLIEMVLNASTNGQPNGRVRVWVDGVLQFDIGNVRYATSGTAHFFGVALAPVWGGLNSTKPQTEWIEFDGLRSGGY